MKHIQRNIGLTLLSLLAISVLAVAPVSARQGSDDDTTTATTRTESTSGRDPSKPPSTDDNSTGTDTETEHGVEVENETEHSVEVEREKSTRVSSIKSDAAKLLVSERKNKKVHTVEERQKSCTARKAALTSKITNYGTHATRQLTAIDSTYAKLQAYQTANNVTAADYAALTSTADAKKTAATAAVAALKAVSTDIDCTADDPAAAVASAKTAVANSRVALQEYRKSVKKVLVSLMNAKNDSKSSSSDDSPSSSTDDTAGGTN